MTIFEAIQELNIPDLTEQAMSRRDAINHACNLSLPFIEHFDKIYNKTEAQVYSEFVDLVLENNNVKKSLKILELMED